MANQSVRKTLAGLQETLAANGQSVRKGLQTKVDLLFLIDGTGSMQNCLDAVKSRALTLYKDIIRGLADKQRTVKEIRVKVIVFRDLYVDTDAYEESGYFTLSEDGNDESHEFRRYIEGIRAMGGGDEPEHALEALHRAMQTDFTPVLQGEKARHIIVMMTDAPAHPLDDPQRDMPEYRNVYPADMPRSLLELQAEWEEMNPHAKRLIIFAPNAYPWPTVATWNLAPHTPSEAGSGISVTLFDQVIAAISGSVS